MNRKLRISLIICLAVVFLGSLGAMVYRSVQLHKSEAARKEAESLVQQLEEELEQVKAGYDSAYGKVDSDEAAVNGYVEQFYNVESRIIQTERKHQQKKNSSKNDDTVKQAREQVESYGDEETKAAWAELEESYELAEQPWF